MNLQLSLASALAMALLHSVWQLALLGLLAAMNLHALRGATARSRHAVAMVWLLAMGVVPLLSLLYSWQLTPPDGVLVGAWHVASGPQAGSAAGGAMPTVSPRRDWLLVGLSQLWLLGVAVMAARQIGGWRWLRRVEGHAFVDLPPYWQQRVQVLSAALGITRRVSVRLAQHVVSPFTAHAFRPLVWLPLALLTRLPAHQVEALLAHELAHIRRLDWVWNGLQCLIETLLFHHPAVWWLSRRIRDERELACDDLAVAVCGDPVALAEALAALQGRGASGPMPAAMLAAGGGTLMKRVAHLLSGTPVRPDWRMPAALLLVLCSGALLALQVAPPAQLLTNFRFDASSSGELTPGNHREYTASYLGQPQRRYRISMDAEGHVDERYAEGGQPRPIDAGVRQWLGALQRAMASEPAPPAAPATPVQSPPRLPSPADFGSDEARALVGGLLVDGRLAAALGQPIRYDRQSFKGSIHTWGSRDFHLWGIDDPVGGKARFTMVFLGPKGRVSLSYEGRTTRGGAWKADRLDLSPLPG